MQGACFLRCFVFAVSGSVYAAADELADQGVRRDIVLVDMAEELDGGQDGAQSS